MSSFSFSKVSIIQSLDLGEFESGTELGKYIDGLRDDHPTVPQVELINVKGREEFLRAIDTLVEEADRLPNTSDRDAWLGGQDRLGISR
jgi:hypothetical protein